MRRPSIRHIGLSSLALALPLALGCGHLHFNGTHTSVFGSSVHEEGGTLEVDGVELPYSRWVDLAAEVPAGSALELAVGTGPIDVSGSDGTALGLSLLVHSEFEGDGTPVVEGGRVTASSSHGGKVFVNALRGTVPNGLELKVGSGTGTIELRNLSGSRGLSVACGTGAISLADVETGETRIDSGTGDVSVVVARATELRVNTGTGAVAIEDAQATLLKVESGTGEVELLRCRIPDVDVVSGTSDLVAKECLVERLGFESGTGDVRLVGGEIGRLRTSFGTGDLSVGGGAQVGAVEGS
jgi:hypothetical protein